jgi:hypothetical protein
MIHPTDRAARRALKHKKESKKTKDVYKKVRKEELHEQETSEEIRDTLANRQETLNGIAGNSAGYGGTDAGSVWSNPTQPDSVD